MRDASTKCGATDPESLRGTNLRKHMASLAITMELGDNEVSELSDFMGHAEKVHRQHYRINPIERQVVKMSQLLEAATGDYDVDEGISSSSMKTDSNLTSNSDSLIQNITVSASTDRKRKQVKTKSKGELIQKTVGKCYFKLWFVYITKQNILAERAFCVLKIFIRKIMRELCPRHF